MTFPRFRPGVTPVGFAVIAIAGVMLVRSLTARNPYEIVISAAIAILWAALCGAGRWGCSRLEALEPNWKPPAPLTANTGEETPVTGLGAGAPWFFRLHVVLCGHFFPSGDPQGCPFRLEAAVPSRAPSIALALSLPMSGVFRGEASCRLRDVFGFFSFHAGVPQGRTVTVRAAPAVRKLLRVDPQSGAEDRRSKAADDEERYYMREYAPGDRFRDINWKSSERIDTLITRVSPDTHEKVRRVEAHFRNYGPAAPTLADLWLLDRAKARFTQFLRLLKESDDRFIFTVYTALGPKDLATMEEIEEFVELLAGLPFFRGERYQRYLSPQPELPPADGEIFVFTTACDAGLQAFLLACQPRPAAVFMAELDEPKAKTTTRKATEDALPATGVARKAIEDAGEATRGVREVTRTLAVSDFVRAGCTPLLQWFFTMNKRRRRLAVTAARVERDYVEVSLW